MPHHPSNPIPQGYRARPATIGDAEAIANLLNRVQLREGGRADVGAESVIHDWDGLNLETETIVITADGDVLAGYSSLINRQHSVIVNYPAVDPTYESNGLGTALIEWAESYTNDQLHLADPSHQVAVRHYPNAANIEARRLLRQKGYEDLREVLVMEIDLPATNSAVAPAGIDIRPFRVGIDDHIAFEMMEDAFRDLWGRPRGTWERFSARVEAPHFDPGIWQLAWDGDQLVGQAWSTISDGEAWIDAVGVLRDWRERGIGLALLDASFAAQAARGATRASLSVDSQSATGASRLYVRAGMTLQRSHIMVQRVLRPGIDPSSGA